MKNMISKKVSRQKARQGQLVIEYVVMFTVIVLVILFAAYNVVRPSMNTFFNKATKIIDNVSDAIDSNY